MVTEAVLMHATRAAHAARAAHATHASHSSKQKVHMLSAQAVHGQGGATLKRPAPVLQMVRAVKALFCSSDVLVTHCQRPDELVAPDTPHSTVIVFSTDIL